MANWAIRRRPENKDRLDGRTPPFQALEPAICAFLTLRRIHIELAFPSRNNDHHNTVSDEVRNNSCFVEFDIAS